MSFDKMHGIGLLTLALTLALAGCKPPDRSRNAHYFATHPEERADVLRDCGSREHRVAAITCTAARNAARLVRTRSKLRAHAGRLISAK
jgi:hypothetical protein